jgi:chromosome segregation ATPase
MERIRVAELTTQKDELESITNSTRADLEEKFKAAQESAEQASKAAQESAEQALKAAQESAEQASKAAQESAEQASKEIEELKVEIEELKVELASEKDANANGWEGKKSDLIAELDEQKQAMIASHNEEIVDLKKAHKDDLNDQTIAFVSLQESLNLKMTAENQNLLEEIANLRKAWDEDKAKFEKMIEDLKGVAQGMEEEKGRLQKIVEQFAEETDVKSKGDLH